MHKPLSVVRPRNRVVALKTGKRGPTKQSMRDECDINKIMQKFQKTGILPEATRKAIYGDFSNPIDYQEAQNLVIKANEQFEGLSARVRERFANDPQKFLEFATNASNAKEMVELGLATKRVPQANLEEKTPTPMGGGKKGSPKAKSEAEE